MSATTQWDFAGIREYYTKLRDKAHEMSPNEWVYIALLWADWDKQLARRHGAPEQQIVIAHLVASVDSVARDGVALLEWLDAFPSAVMDLR